MESPASRNKLSSSVSCALCASPVEAAAFLPFVACDGCDALPTFCEYEEETLATKESFCGTNGLYALSSTDVNNRIVEPLCGWPAVGVSSSCGEYAGGPP